MSYSLENLPEPYKLTRKTYDALSAGKQEKLVFFGCDLMIIRSAQFIYRDALEECQAKLKTAIDNKNVTRDQLIARAKEIVEQQEAAREAYAQVVSKLGKETGLDYAPEQIMNLEQLALGEEGISADEELKKTYGKLNKVKADLLAEAEKCNSARKT